MRPSTLYLLTLAVFASTAFAQEDVQSRSGGVDVIAHRGASAYAPENTLAAFEKAIELGADWFELDCSLTKDSEIVVIHDDTLERTTDGRGPVIEFTMEELRELDAGSWMDPKFAGERLPTLKESLDLARGRIGVYVEIKDSDNDAALRRSILARVGDEGSLIDDGQTIMSLIEQSGTRNYALAMRTIDRIRAENLGDDVVIQSFSPIVCAITITQAPEIRTEFLAEDRRDEEAAWEEVIEWVRLLDPQGFNPNRRAMKVRAVQLQRIRDAGTSIAVWTVDGSRAIREYAAWGVSRIITNRPDNAVEALLTGGFRKQ